MLTANADSSLVSYINNSNVIDFEPGCIYSPTDLFPNFKGVMPGDTLSQEIVLEHTGNKNYSAKIYIRALGAVDVNSERFLSQLTLRVNTEGKRLFNAPASATTGLEDWVYICTLDTGEKATLDLVLSVPTSLGDDYQNEVGYLDWEFMVEAYKKNTPKPPRPIPSDDFIKYRIEAFYYTDGVADNEVALPLYANEKAKSLPSIDEVKKDYAEQHKSYNDNAYEFTSIEFDPKTNIFTLRYDRKTTPTEPDKPDEPIVEYYRYTVVANYFTNGEQDNETPIPVFASGDVEELPGVDDVKALYFNAFKTYNGNEYTSASVEFNEEGSRYTIIYERTYVTPLPDEPDKPDIPQTGDESNVVLWVTLFALSFIILIILIVILSRKRKEDTNN